MQRARLGWAVVGLALLGCGGSTEPQRTPLGEGPATRSLFLVPSSLDEFSEGTFFDHPWPSDARLDPDGTPRFDGYPNPRGSTLLRNYLTAVEDLVVGFSPAASGFLRFQGAIDVSSLPSDPPATLLPSASVQLIDVDPDSPERGQRKLVSLRYQKEAGVYWPENTLSFMPTLGFPLRASTRYALVVTDGVRAEDGSTVGRAPALDQVLGFVEPSDEVRALRDLWAPSIDEIENAGIERERIVHLTVFTTGDPTAELFAIRDDLHQSYPAPSFDDAKWTVVDQSALATVFEGEYGPSPDYQRGDLPFSKATSGGGFDFQDGMPVVQRDFSLRFVLAVPNPARCPMPERGYPVVLHAHGTGGDYRSHLRSGTFDDLAERCIASMGIDQIFHGNRPGAPPPGPGKTQAEQILFFNFENPVAARTNPRQAAIDEIQRARLFTETQAEIPASVTGGDPIRFDPERVMFFGHSQGGLNGPLFLAADDGALGGVLSGSGSMIAISLLEKTEPLDIARLVKGFFLGLDSDEQGEVDSFHPAISLAQTIVDAADPIHYVARIALEPRPGQAPKSVYQTEGVNEDGSGDSYTPPRCIRVQAVATGLPLQEPVIFPFFEHEWAGLEALAIPAGGVSGNLADGRASGVLAQWPAQQASDGHFVVFQVDAARRQAADFLRHLADDPKGSIPPP